jgi:2,3-bisphosphoglycerate-dependent phosphoglycerate mutase
MKRLFLIRHGESESNAGGRTQAPHSTDITERGRAQAHRLAKTWKDEPHLIVTSPFIRTKHTAAPLIERFPDVPRVEWPIQEFTQLMPREWIGTTHSERMPKVMEYWNRADPSYCDGPGAESLTEFFRRVRGMLARAEEAKEESVAVFTHGHFIQAVIWACLVNPRLDTAEAMRRFFRFAEIVPIENTAVVPLVNHGTHWTVGPVQEPRTV